MGEPLDPELARALQEPARLVRADPRLLDLVREAGPPARQQLRAQASEAGSAQDRYASAALLACLFGDRGPLEQAARDHGSSPPRELLALADVTALRPALRKSLASPVHTGLLEWATQPDAANPPLELAMAARDLQLDDAAVLRSVADRAEQLAAQSGKRGQRPPLERFAEILRQTAEQGTGRATTPPAPQSRPAPGPEPAVEDPVTNDPRPGNPGRGGSGPRVTTKGIPPSEMLGPDELDEPDPYDYPGTGVPVRDSISGPRPGPDPRSPGLGSTSDPGSGGAAPADGPPAPGPAMPRVPSTSEQYYGAGSDRYAGHDPNSPQTRESDKHVLRNWGIVFLVIVAVIIVLTLLL